MNILQAKKVLPSNGSQVIEKAIFTYLFPGKTLEKQVKTIEEHGKQLV